MNRPEIWEKYKPHRQYVKTLMEEYKTKFNWSADGRDSLMDIGCAGGGITIDYILPIMPTNFDRLIGVDISEDMIAYAQKMHSKPNIEFKTFNIETGNTGELPQVDHITVLYVFHLVHDHDKALSNVYNLLKPGGDCLILFIPQFRYYTAYEQLSRHPKWSKYMKSVKDAIVPCYFSETPESDFEQLLKKHRFSSVEIATDVSSYHMGDVNIFKKFITTVYHFYEGIPLEEHDAFTDDFARVAVNVFNSIANNKQSNENGVYLPVTNLIAVARK
ncbi:juvenile hormone acid O-methyltransferase-like [Bradysia coprophila]|uniref:juvenile hormone acid O-methyltransferase-like n=1 Tax=Bradysia coprophila TaxID=38358 RepID=UPI00187DA35B|nr:juvenile hormone acid O-methyltransferase-like [Bradysia coprophila]